MSINLNDLTLGQLRELQGIFGGVSTAPLGATSAATPARDHGFCIIILDRGWVYVGYATEREGWLEVGGEYCYNIRYWGTGDGPWRGLGKLAAEGKTAKTQLDRTDVFKAPLTSVIHIIPAVRGAWT